MADMERGPLRSTGELRQFQMPATCVCVFVYCILSLLTTHTRTHTLAGARGNQQLAVKCNKDGAIGESQPAVRHQRVRERAQIWPQVLPTLSIVANNMPLIHIASARLRPAASATGRKHSTVLHFVLRNCSPPPPGALNDLRHRFLYGCFEISFYYFLINWK